MNILNYFPSYPFIHNENFYQEIFNKKEFRNLSTAEEVSDTYTNHQLFVSRFISPWTKEQFRSILLIHDTGTGKSASVSAILNGLKQFDPNTKMLYLTNNETLEANFKKELLRRCPYLEMRRKNFDGVEKSFFRSEQITFNTFSSFANELLKSNMFGAMKRYRNYFIVLDEAHHLVSESLQVYKTFHHFLHSLQGTRLCVMTATPMRDNLLEAIYLLNLVLPLKKNFPVEEKFVEEYLLSENMKHLHNYSVEKLENYTWKNEAKAKQFMGHLKGYVSVFRQKAGDVDVSYVGKVLKPMEYVPIVEDYFTETQEKIYLQAFQSDVKNPSDEKDVDGSHEKYSNFYSNSVQASLMVFPNGSWGTKNTSKYLINNDRFSTEFLKETGIRYKMTSPEFLNILKNYSIIYYNVMKDILDEKNQDKCFYVYCEKINGSGVLRLINLLCQFAEYSLVKTETLDWSKKAKRCIFLNEKEGIKVKISKQLELFNDKRNKNGEYIRVIFGTDKTREGITLKNIQKIHILTPGWNFGKKNQAVGRGIRLYSHLDLENPQVDINLHCGLAKSQPLFRSVNYLQYIRSEIKEKNIFLFSYAFLLSAVDCQVNKYNNFRLAEDYSAACFFKPCKYKCLGISQSKSKVVDEGNYNVFYYRQQMDSVIEKILYFIQEEELYSFFWYEILQKVYSPTLNDFVIFQALQQIMSAPIPIQRKNGTLLFLVQERDYFYTSTFPKESEFDYGYLIGNQQRTQRFWPKTNVLELRKDMFSNETILADSLNNLKTCFKDNKNAKEFFSTFPLEIQKVVLATLTDNYLKQLGTLTNQENGKVLLHIGKECFEIDKKNETVQHCLSSENNGKKEIKSSKEMEEKLITNNPFEIYAILSKNNFKIRDISDEKKKGPTKSKTIGQNCNSILLDKIYYYSVLLSDVLEEQQYQKVKEDLTLLIPVSKRNSLLSKFSNYTNDEIVTLFENEKISCEKLFVMKDLNLHQIKLFILLKTVSMKRNIICSYLLELFKQKHLALML